MPPSAATTAHSLHYSSLSLFLMASSMVRFSSSSSVRLSSSSATKFDTKLLYEPLKCLRSTLLNRPREYSDRDTSGKYSLLRPCARYPTKPFCSRILMMVLTVVGAGLGSGYISTISRRYPFFKLHRYSMACSSALVSSFMVQIYN